MKVVGVIILIVIAIAAIGGMGDSDKSDTATAAVDSSTTEAGRLAEKGEDIASEIAALSNEGLELVKAKDTVGACAIVDTQIQKVNQLGDIVTRLGEAGLDTGELEQNEIELRGHIGKSRAACNSLGL